MNLQEDLYNITKMYGKTRYTELTAKMYIEAEKGNFYMDIMADDILAEDVDKLREEGLEVTFYEGADYDYYVINWG